MNSCYRSRADLDTVFFLGGGTHLVVVKVFNFHMSANGNFEWDKHPTIYGFIYSEDSFLQSLTLSVSSVSDCKNESSETDKMIGSVHGTPLTSSKLLQRH